VLCSCAHENEPKVVPNKISKVDANPISSENKVEKTSTALESYDWRKYQDSLRNVLLKGKENKILKESFLQEMYIRNVVKVSRDSLFVTIPFNLHGPDCGAPDCYSTDISISFKLGDKLIFPKNIPFIEHEHGCVDKERKLSGSFQLVEETEKHVIYHSTKHERTLVLFSLNKENGTTAYYFTGVGQNRINGQNIYNIIKDYNEEDKSSIYPFTSWVLTTNEYENFIR
jgi:hypothetical protein